MASDWQAHERARVEAALATVLPGEDVAPVSLHRAMRYSVLAGGKRLRPLLCLASAEAVAGQPVATALPLACALELLHTYSLIHDDLPALDNDDLRRGRPTCHKQFGEAIAILAGDALLTLAFAQFARPEFGDDAGRLLHELVAAAGTPAGMLAGQVADLEAARTTATAPLIEFIHRNKTAALIRAAMVLGGMAAHASAPQLETLGQAGEELGLAFQIVDDILDVTGSAEELGKSAGKDQAQNKATYPAVFGLEASRRQAERLGQQALARLAHFPAAAGPLRALAHQIIDRRG